MKTTAVAVTMALVLGLSNMAFAGFGLGNILGGTKAKSDQSTTQQTQKVDISDLTDKQGKVLQMMSAAAQCSAAAHITVADALNSPANSVIAAQNALKADHSNLGKIKNLTKADTGNPISADTFKAAANGTAEQKAKLKSAMEQAKLYRYASYACYGLAANEASGMIKEAGASLKLIGAGNFNMISKVNGIINTGKAAGTLFNLTQSHYNAYDKNTAGIKQLLGVKDVKPDQTQINQVIKNLKDQDGLNF